MANIELGTVPTWFDVRGDGEPVVLLHGGFVDSRTFAPALPLLISRFQVYRVDRRGHGHTPDVPGPLSYAALAADLAAFLERVVGGPAHLVGHSDGANLALRVALDRPDLVRKLVLISGNHHAGGLLPGVLDGFEDEAAMAHLAARHGEVSPDGEEHFPELARKVIELGRAEPDYAAEDLKNVAARTLVMAGDDDAIAMEHTLEQYRAIPDAELAIVPGTSHLLVVEKPELVYGLVGAFLGTDPEPTRQPIRRAGR
ncbi:alpha/beta fold hydrolase [Nocardia harenae]|uniref:alpha/beta fold hydrolase n=1 Tax=Nocardia harenae TaxID=358707 RepID=UPI00082FB853|nr:alpha/beta hydrolase [Nocardia harenae]